MDLIHKKKENRAQIFQSFDSLKGFKEMIQECEVEIVSPRILLSIMIVSIIKESQA